MKPLEGITVLDFSRVLAGPMATMILAELGAQVIKIERPNTGDESRHWEPKVASESAYFFAFNRAKQSITLDLKQKEGQSIARRLAKQADVLVENFPTGTMARLGLDYATLKDDNPNLVYVANTGFGQDGPYATRKGYDTIFQAMSGMMSLTGDIDGGPVKAGLPSADLSSGLWIAIAALSGIAARSSSGHGCFIDLSMFDAQVSLLTIAAARYFALNEVPQRWGTQHPGRVPSASFQCRDKHWLHISASDQHWHGLCRVLKLDALVADESLATNAGRVAARERIMHELGVAIANWTRPDLLNAFTIADIPAGPINAVDDIVNDAHVQARGLVGEFEHPVTGRFRALRNPLRFEGYTDPNIGTPPLLGEHTEDVLRDMLGLSERELAALKKNKVV